MAAGSISYKLSDFSGNRMGAQVEVRGNVTKLLEDEDGVIHSLGSWQASVMYATAGFGARTMASINADLIAEIKAKNAAISAKTIT